MSTISPTTHVEVLVIGAGQAGLALAWHLRRRGIDVLVVDAGPEIGHAWRSRWDSLRLFTPAEHDALPGLAFPAAAGTYPGKDQVAGYLRDYADTYELPVRLSTRVTRLAKDGGVFRAQTSTGTVTADQVVVATGPFQTPYVPDLAGQLPPAVTQLHSAGYRNPDQLADGPVLVVGAANSGLQIALELAATRQVTVAAGSRPPMLPQRLLGRDLFWWLTRLGVLTKPADSPLARRLRRRGDLVIGTRPRDVRRAGIEMRPRLTSVDGAVATFSDRSTTTLSTVVWATGFRPDYSWLDVPGVLADGRIVQKRGVTAVPGLSVIGQPWQHTRGSALLGFVGEDARWLAEHLARERPARSAARPVSPATSPSAPTAR